MEDAITRDSKINVVLLTTLGLGAGALLGLALARRAAQQSHLEISESVEELKERTQRALNELSENVTGLLDQTRTTLQETIVHGAEES